MKARLTGFLEKYIPALDKLKHDYIGVWVCIGYIPFILLNINCIWFYVAWAIASALNELHQKITKTGEASFRDWCFGMRAPTIVLLIILLLLSRH